MTAPAISTLPDGMGQQVLVVEPYDVERGDRLAGLRTPVDSLLYDGNVGMWLYVDARGVTVLYVAPLWQDAAGTIPYAGEGAERRERLQ